MNIIQQERLIGEDGNSVFAFVSKLEQEDLNGKLSLMSKLSSSIEEACSSNQADVIEHYYQINCHVFLSSESKNPLKHYSARSLMKFPPQYRSDIASYLSKNLINLMEHDTSFSLKHCLNKVSDCFDNFPIGIDAISLRLEEVLLHICKCLRHTLENLSDDLSPMEQNDLIATTHSALRAAVIILQKFLSRIKSNFETNYLDAKKTVKDMLQACTQLLNHELIPMDSKLNCGLVVVILSSVVCANGNALVLSKLSGDKSTKENVSFLETIDFKSKLAQMSVCYGLLNIIPLEDLCICEENGKKYFMDVILRKLVFLSESTDNNLCLGCSRALQQAVHLLHSATVKRSSHNCLEMLASTDILTLCIDFVWVALDHYVDCVRHSAKTILSDLVQIGDFIYNKGGSDVNFGDVIINMVVKLPSYKKSKYIALAVLANEFGFKKLKNVFPDLVSTLLEVLEDPSMSSHASNAFESLMMKNFKEENEANWVDIWIFPLFNAYSKSKVCYILENIIAKAMTICPAIMNYAMASLKEDAIESSKLKVIIVCLKTGAKLGMLDKVYAQTNASNMWKGIIKYDSLMLALVNGDDEIRLAALSLIVESNKTTRSFDTLELELVKCFLWYNINSDGASLKQKNLMLQKKVLTRIRESAYPLMKTVKLKKENDPQVVKARRILEAYNKYLKWLYIFCYKCLFPGANSTRQASALEILVLIDEIFSSENGKLLGVDGSKLFESKEHEDFANLLLTCLRDSFESNKNLAFKMLIRFPTESLSFKEQSWIHDYLHVGLKLASSVKPPDCITAAYLLKFVVSFSEADKILIEEASKVVSSDFLPNIDIIAKDISFYQKNTFYIIWILFEQLRKELAIGNQNLLLAAGSGPMYGTLFSIRHLLNTLDYNEVAENTMWKALILKLITLCFELNEAVIHVVNSSSPEGHLPMDFEPASHHDAVKKVDSALEDGNQDFILKHPVTAQMLLLCSWRTVKEVSLFLGEVSYQAPIQKKILGNDEECYLLSEDLVLRIGEYFTKLLSETKHRGAFEQAYVGFCQLCKKLWRHPAGILSSLPKVWLKDILNAIIKGKKSSKLCATRRSAGVPFIVQALVTTEINVRQPTSLKESMDILLGLLEKTETVSDEKNEEVDEVESRTHAMNILRALFRHTLLGEYVIPYIARGIMAAIKGFKGHTWAERNSATLLFGALIIRIFGVKHSREDMHRRNRMTGRVFFERFPLLYDFILEELKVASVAAPSGDFSCDQQLTPCIHPSLFPLLVLLSRLYPSSLEGTDSNMQLSAFIPPLKFCLKSKIYKIRELTARAIVPLIASNVYITHLNEAFNEVVSIEVDQNYLHGVLLQISMLLLEVPYPQKETRECLSKSVDFWVSPSVKILTDGPQINCMVKEAYVRVLRHLLLISSSSVNSFFPEVLWNNVFYILQNCIKQFNSSSGISSQLLNLGGTTWVQRATQILLEIAVITGHSSELLVEILCSFLTSSCCVECITVALSFISSVFGEEGCECNEEEDGLPLFEWPRTNDWLNRVLIHRTHFIQDHRLAYAAVNFLLCSSDSHILQKVLKVVGYLAVSSLSIKWQKVNSDSVVIEVNPYLYLVNLWQSQPENVGRAAFFCLSTFVHEALSSEKKECLTSEIGSLYCDLLLEFSSAEKSELSRIAVAEALVNNHLLLCIPNLSFSTWDRCRAWVVALDLLGDHSECVRETAARIFRMLTFSNELLKSLSDSTRNSPVSNHQDKNSIKTGHLESDWTGPKVPIVDHPGDMIPERLKELMVLYFSRVLSPVDKYECVTTLLVLILRDDGCEEAEDNVNEERVFDKAEVNLYAEWLPLAKVCAQILCEIMDDSLLNITSFIPSSVMLLVGLEDFEASSVLDFLKAAVLRITKKIEACEKTNGMIFNSFLTPGYDLIQKEAFKIGFVLSSLKTKSDEILILCDNFFQRLANSEILLRFSVLCERHVEQKRCPILNKRFYYLGQPFNDSFKKYLLLMAFNIFQKCRNASAELLPVYFLI